MSRRGVSRGGMGWLVLVGLAAVGRPLADAAYTDVTAASGIRHVHAIESEVPLNPRVVDGRPTRTVQSNYAAAAAVDVDGDGWTDLVAARHALPPVLYLNQRNGTFREEAVARGLGLAVNAGGFAAGDLDNDGDQDLFVVPAKGPRFWLFLNDGTGHFTESAEARGAAVPVTLHDHEGYSVGLVDHDADGYLDISVSEWGVPTSAEDALHAVLLRNRGATAPGTFVNVSAAAGPGRLPAGDMRHHAFASAWADFDGDGWPDLARVGDFGASQMWWNNGNGTFIETERESGVGQDEFGMGVAVADYDLDGRLDFYVTSIYDAFFHERQGSHTGNKLYRNLGDRRFAEVARSTGVDRTDWGWGAAFLEFENDGDPDLIVTNGMDAAETGPTGPFFPALTDPTTLFVNDGTGRLDRVTSFVGLADTGYGKAVVVWDYDNDGDEDVLITQTFAAPVLYRSDASGNGRGWIQFRFQGSTSARDGYGAIVRVTEGGRTQTLLFNPTNSYLGQREARLHVGLGAVEGTVDAVEVTWPSGIRQAVTNLSAGQVHLLAEPAATLSPPVIAREPPAEVVVAKDAELVLTVEASAQPEPVYGWEKDGGLLVGATGPQFRLRRTHPFDAGSYRVQVINAAGSTFSRAVDVRVSIDPSTRSVARWWNEALLDAIRADTPNPPVHARNLYHLSAAVWDAFWPYEPEGWSRAQPVFHREEVGMRSDPARLAAQRETISYAAYRLLTERFSRGPGRERSQFGFRWLMDQLGYDPDFTGTSGSSPAAVGNRIGAAVLAATRDDGANEVNGYADATGYVAANPPLIVALPGAQPADPSRWQPLALRVSVAQNGLPLPEGVQPFVGVNARQTTAFALAKSTPTTLALDPGPPPGFGGGTHAEYVQQAIDCLTLSSYLDPGDAVVVDISPGAHLNNRLGANDGRGRARNPVTGEPYAPNLVLRGDYARVLAEYWADGPASETPPGHWNVIHHEVTDHPAFERRMAGGGPELTPLAWDVQALLALNGALHDAACAAWTLKRQYDSARPISVIRHLAGLGQSSDPAAPSYHVQGLPLVSGLIEVVTEASAAVGERHAHLADFIGEVAVRTWRGNPLDPRRDTSGVGWIRAREWVPFQLPTFVSPAFPGYVSGHSTFSRAGAEVLTLLTGTPFFPGGLGSRRFAAESFLTVEQGPSAGVTLQWATYADAADQAGLSRLFGGIHPSVDDLTGRRMGSRIGLDAFLEFQSLRAGGVPRRGLVNVSSRGRTRSGEGVMIAGFVTAGESPQPALLRAVGPGLEPFGVSREQGEQNPRIELRRAGAAEVMLANDDWGAGARLDEVVARTTAAGAFALTAGSADAAGVVELAPGAYSVMAPASAERGGIVLTEVYAERLANVSTRGIAGPGDDVLIVGFAIATLDPAVVLIRGVGPGLAAFGLTSALPNPVLRVYRHPAGGAAELLAVNDDWSADDRASLATSGAGAAGAFVLDHGSRDAALVLQLPAGNYSAVVGSAGDETGVVLVEVYHLR